MARIDVVIVGQGLAGTALAWRLIERGISVLIVDEEAPMTCSRAAAGLVNPLSGQGWNLGWRQAEAWPESLEFYQKKETEFREKFALPNESATCWHEMPILRLFANEQERERLMARLEAPERAQYISQIIDSQKSIAPWRAKSGGVVLSGGGWLDTEAWLSASKFAFKKLGIFHSGTWNWEEVSGESPVCWHGFEFSKVILAQGYKGLISGPCQMKNRCSKGEILDIKFAEPVPAGKMINSDGWMAPRPNNVWRAGATYSWGLLDEFPSAMGRAQVLAKIAALTTVVPIVKNHLVGVRPIVRQSQPVLAKHPEKQWLWSFNGLGSKGTMSSIFAARLATESLFENRPIPADLDGKMFF